jgi:hypothetical protein
MPTLLDRYREIREELLLLRGGGVCVVWVVVVLVGVEVRCGGRENEKGIEREIGREIAREIVREIVSEIVSECGVEIEVEWVEKRRGEKYVVWKANHQHTLHIVCHHLVRFANRADSPDSSPHVVKSSSLLSPPSSPPTRTHSPRIPQIHHLHSHYSTNEWKTSHLSHHLKFPLPFPTKKQKKKKKKEKKKRKKKEKKKKKLKKKK